MSAGGPVHLLEDVLADDLRRGMGCTFPARLLALCKGHLSMNISVAFLPTIRVQAIASGRPLPSLGSAPATRFETLLERNCVAGACSFRCWLVRHVAVTFFGLSLFLGPQRRSSVRMGNLPGERDHGCCFSFLVALDVALRLRLLGGGKRHTGSPHGVGPRGVGDLTGAVSSYASVVVEATNRAGPTPSSGSHVEPNAMLCLPTQWNNGQA